MACIRRSSRGGALAFDGFEGEQGYRETTERKLNERLTDLQSIHSKEEHAAEQHSHAQDREQQDRTNMPDERRTTTLQDIEAILSLALDLSECRDDLALCGDVRVQAVRVSKKRDPESPILDSPFGPELAHVRQLWKQGKVGRALERYVLGIDPRQCMDVLRNDDGLEVLRQTMPTCMPVGRWPSRFPMALAQQFAVNTIKRDLLSQSEGLFSVNGPPGTGKTTLLRDVIAILVVERARQMAKLHVDAKQPFERADNGVRGDRPGPMFKLRPELRGYGMVVACFSNKAAQNVTRELPAAKSIDAENVTVDYFADVAETVFAPEEARSRVPGSAWGLIAAVLGKSELRNHFINRFWFAQSHEPRKGETPTVGLPFVSFQTVLANGDPGAVPWETQCQRFLNALAKAEAALARRQKVAEALCERDELHTQVRELDARHRDADAALSARQHELSQAAQKQQEARQQLDRAKEQWERALELARTEQDLASHVAQVPPICGVLTPSRWTPGAADNCLRELRALIEVERRALADMVLRRPGFFARWVGTQGSHSWQMDHKNLSEQLRMLERTSIQFAGWIERYASLTLAVTHATKALPDPLSRPHLPACQRAFDVATVLVESTAQEHLSSQSRHEAARRAEASALAAHTQAARKCRQAQAALNESGFDETVLEGWRLARKSEKERQLFAPWSDAELDALRHSVFIEALALHRSFIAQNAAALRKNLSLWVDMIKGVLPASHVAAGVEHLWESFFLCIPVVSTTFHALPTLFRGMREKSLGWLLIDEAGQVTPQAAVCGIVRAARTIVVGDPLQLEPVFTLPGQIVDALEDRLGVTSQWNPRRASCQALADRANRYGTIIQDKWVGAPLRVHRRCIEPMFSVANEISYRNMMVYGTQSSANDPEWLGPSCWVDVPSQSGNGHWIPEQGQIALALFDAVVSLDHNDGRLFDEDGRPNAFVIAPFKDVAENAQQLLERRGIDCADEICGTVHTFQGKESDVVILLLGGDLKKPRAISSFAAGLPNLLNVALTRAKRRIYVVGQRDQWAKHSFYSLLAETLPVVTAAQILRSGESEHHDLPRTGRHSVPGSSTQQSKRTHG